MPKQTLCAAKAYAPKHIRIRIAAGMRHCILLFFAGCLVACNPTKYVPKDEYLLRSVDVKIDNKTIGKEQLNPYIRQKPNKKIIGMNFHLWLYNRSKLEKDNKWNKWLRKNGEEPVKCLKCKPMCRWFTGALDPCAARKMNAAK